MEIANCMLRIASDSAHIVKKIDVTPAEVVILRALHGAGAVFSIEIQGLSSEGKDTGKRSHSWERARLINKYQRAPGALQNLESSFNGGSPDQFSPGHRTIVTTIFPGLNPVLPVKFSDVEVRVGDDEGIEVDDNSGDVSTATESDPIPEEVASTPRRGRRRTAAATEEVASTGEGEETPNE